MTTKPFRRPGRISSSDIWIIIGVVTALLFFVISGSASLYNIRVLQEDNARIIHTHDVIVALDDLLSTVQDSETGQRGYLLTGSDQYLEPYNAAVADVLARTDALASLTADNPDQQANLALLKGRIDAKLAELKETIDLRRTQGLSAALAVVESDAGKAEMDAIRSRIAVMRQEETQLRVGRLAEMQGAYRRALAGSVLTAALGVGLTLIIGFLTRRASTLRARQAWLRKGQIGLSEAMLGDKTVERLSEDILIFLADFLSAQAGVLFKGEHDHFRLVARLGIPADAPLPGQISGRDGMVGQAAAEGQAMVVNDLPESYLTVGSALGRDRPRHLAFVPFKAEGRVNGVAELAFLRPVDSQMVEFLEAISASVGVALRSARYRTELQLLLEETQRQSEELQVQSEELRVSNEELEEQSNALKDSQTRLEQQQVELEQTNSQLEEQARQLENQRDDLARTAAQIELKARELEQASQYKSDFLANMSHELRTPLNSLLILSKLLGDNGQGNLTDEQVKYARTIQSSGNDLLTLINDILDLSKIEAGHVQIRPESLPLQRLAGELRQVFQPLAQEKKLKLDIVIAKDTPSSIETDRQRLEQVLKNLLSNAFKFTEKGGVKLTIEPAPEGVAFAVNDSGIGISPEQHQAIFEAFQQADGTISRRFGGTGLGLSISRELTRLLGGTIGLQSTPGEGSTFTVALPLAFDPSRVAPRAERPSAAVSAPSVLPASPIRIRPMLTQTIEDDRDALESGRRLLLVIEDDASFAGIVRDLAHELGFQCVIANTAEQAVEAARTFRPNAVVLDVGLPDQSGLTVLDRLKRADETRHIPIHVVSAADHSQTALSLGAVGYLVKPVKREDLASALQALDARLSQGVRRVLIVEDDPVQRDALSKLLASGDVETVGAASAAECLEKLRSQTFDCMVLDLSLGDSSGFDLLETLSQDQDYAFPPVIVYTGHDLTEDEEQRLRRYSSSIIIKGAKSPERLLDEVSLFLHRVVSELPAEQQRMIRQARSRDAVLEGRRILVVEDDVRNVYALSNILEPRGAVVEIARNGEEAIRALEKSAQGGGQPIDLVLMDVMMPVMDGLEATRQIRRQPHFAKLPIIMLTAKAMLDDQEKCLAAGANDYMAKPLDIDRLLSLVRVWMPR